jgi:hypothetical protein
VPTLSKLSTLLLRRRILSSLSFRKTLSNPLKKLKHDRKLEMQRAQVVEEERRKTI